MSNVGSVWGKWDLHIHTPASYLWRGVSFNGRALADNEERCKEVLKSIEDSDVMAFCIMDYWTFDGYRLLRECMATDDSLCSKMIFPGVEFRLEAPTDYKLNAHVLFNNELPMDTLESFLSTLRFSAPNGKPVTRSNFIELARGYGDDKLGLHSFRPEQRADDEAMYRCGLMTAEVSRKSLEEAMDTIGEENCLFILPYDTSDGVSDLDWKCHPYSDKTLMSWANCFESRKKVHVDLFLGNGHPTKPEIGENFIANIGGFPKPVFAGSDAHKIGEYGVYPSERATWLKAQPTFKGLKQVCHEPALRCHIGDSPEKLQHVIQNPTKYITKIRLEKEDGSLPDEHWFDGKEIHFNPGLVAIIGNKGSGKSALADIIALAGNAHCKNMEFLNSDRFRVKNNNKAQYFNATVSWADGTDVPIELDSDPDMEEPERVRYLPQHFIEDLCNEIATGQDTEFEQELKKVIFDHTPKPQQLNAGSLDDLIDSLVKAKQESLANTRQEIRDLNQKIVRNEEEITEETLKSYRTDRDLKIKELEAIDKPELEEVKKPEDDPKDAITQAAVAKINATKDEQEKLAKQIEELQEEQLTLVTEQARLGRVAGYVDNFEAQHETFVEEHKQEFDDAGFDVNDIIKVTIDREPIINNQQRVKERLAEIKRTLDGTPATEVGEEAVKGLVEREKELTTAIEKLQEGLNAPQKAYQAFLKEKRRREDRKKEITGTPDQPETIEYFNARIKRATEVIPGLLEDYREQRRNLIREMHKELVEIRNTYTELYAPVQKIATDATTAAEFIELEFDASIVDTGFETAFSDFIHRGKRGSFQGDESQATFRNIISKYDFNNEEDLVGFTDELIEVLTNVERDGETTDVTIKSQLRNKKTVRDLYDNIFTLDYLDIRYNLRLGGKEISQLSPGEKGGLLLVFYLLLDREEIPIIIDQPEHNLDNESVVQLLVDCIRTARARRQVFIVTHNPNLAVYCDADQLICCKIDKADGNRISYHTGAIEDYSVNSFAVNVLEGTYPAFDNRRKKWHKPEQVFAAIPEEG